MVQDIACKCLSDLVKDWQASESGTTGSSPHYAEVAGITNTNTKPGPSTYVGEYSISTEAPQVFNQNQTSSFNDSDYSGFLGHLAPIGSSGSYTDLPQRTDLMSPTAELSMNAEKFIFQEDIQFSFFCLENPPHPETQGYKGKGKGREYLSCESRDPFCPTCFPRSGIQTCDDDIGKSVVSIISLSKY
jgi:hypothetical protein